MNHAAARTNIEPGIAPDITPDITPDIVPGTWVLRALPGRLRPYALLMRLDRPSGTCLVMAPAWWAIALAAPGPWPDVAMLALFALGALVMRGAGCVVNDIIDRDVDAQVARTKARPLPSGQVRVAQAWTFAALLCATGLVILLQLNRTAIALGALSVIALLVYPFAKRFTYWPQVFLGTALSWGALLGWAAERGTLNAAPFVLFAAGVAWTLGWDTIYGHQDKHDDPHAGVKSGALKMGDATPYWVAGFYALAVGLIGVAGWLADLSALFYPALAAAAAHLVWQVATLDLNDPANCRDRFAANRTFGLLAFAALVIGRVL